jgi:hypothetical protein
MMTMQTLCLSFGFVLLTDEVISKVTFDMQIHGKYTLSTKYCLSEVHVTNWGMKVLPFVMICGGLYMRMPVQDMLHNYDCFPAF